MRYMHDDKNNEWCEACLVFPPVIGCLLVYFGAHKSFCDGLDAIVRRHSAQWKVPVTMEFNRTSQELGYGQQSFPPFYGTVQGYAWPPSGHSLVFKAPLHEGESHKALLKQNEDREVEEQRAWKAKRGGDAATLKQVVLQSAAEAPGHQQMSGR